MKLYALVSALVLVGCASPAFAGKFCRTPDELASYQCQVYADSDEALARQIGAHDGEKVCFTHWQDGSLTMNALQEPVRLCRRLVW